MTSDLPVPTDVRSSRIDQLADRFVDDSAALDPLFATALGVPGQDHLLPDFSPDGRRAVADVARTALRDLEASAAEGGLDAEDRVTVAAMKERLGLQLEMYDSGETERDLNVIASPVQEVRLVFDMMKTDTADDWSTIAQRLAAVPVSLGTYRASLLAARGRGQVAARRQVEKSAVQCDEYGAANGFFAEFAAREDVPESVRADLADSARAAGEGYLQLGRFLREELLPHAAEQDAVGRERYALGSRLFLGATVDLEETYQWGLDELARIESEMAKVADQIVPGGSVDDAAAALDGDPGRVIHGKEQFREWMQALADQTVTEMGATHFDIPEPVRRIECKIAPTTTGGIYYLPPSADFTRAGAMWWSVPEGVEDFSTWREVTTVFHEGVPGHHLQCGQTAFRSNLLNRWRRLACWVSGHGEGWALYAERLMAELGYLDEPGGRLGLFAAQGFRVARVVLDLGAHPPLPTPTGCQQARPVVAQRDGDGGQALRDRRPVVRG
ncbi:MAG: DUF885 domain-containing protein, partial [Jatrophihabitans sp.]